MNTPFAGYGREYLSEYERRARSEIAHRIIQSRWELVTKYCAGGTLLDYGCATGAFHLAAPNEFAAIGWDVNPHSLFGRAKPRGHFHILTMWDVIEHMPDPFVALRTHTPEFVFICTPNAENTDINTFKTWKHFKPGEHLHYFTPLTLSMLTNAAGYDTLGFSYSEGLIRDCNNPTAILSAAFVRQRGK